jgi:mono/diheme cytochrome c family protein
MLHREVSLVLAGVLSAALVSAAQQPEPRIQNIPIKQTSAANGRQMFSTYCAVCHGADAKGTGPAAKSMKVAPADLTQLSAKNGGVFPANHVSTVLDFGIENPAHGSAQMPIWGDLFRTLSPVAEDSQPLVHQRISNITDYLKTLQQ